MTDRPILFSAAMIRAILAGRKTQTRRIVKWLDGNLEPKARYAVADRLWVKETWQIPALCPIQYRASATERIGHWNPEIGPWKPSIFMRRSYSRLTLTVTDVRFMRLMSITETDAEAEGADPILVPPDGGSAPHVEGFRQLWNSIHGPDADFANPLVAAYTFTVAQRNIDA